MGMCITIVLIWFAPGRSDKHDRYLPSLGSPTLFSLPVFPCLLPRPLPSICAMNSPPFVFPSDVEGRSGSDLQPFASQPQSPLIQMGPANSSSSQLQEQFALLGPNISMVRYSILALELSDHTTKAAGTIHSLPRSTN